MIKVHIDSSSKSLNKTGEELCGDKVMIKRNKDFFTMVVADGLGSGVKANILSTLTSTIISEMIHEGSSIEEVVDTISSTLPVCKERGIAYSTFLILQINYNGEAKIVEYDSPSAIVIRENKVVHINKEEKIINNRKIKISKFIVEPNDYIVAFSDGIIHAGMGMVLNLGWDIKEITQFLLTHIRNEDSAKEVCRILLSNVNSLYGGLPQDDSTVACARVIRAKETVVMVGPPSNKEDDNIVVHKLLSASGLKICCGGTTSNIVARALNKQVETDELISCLNDVPPKGYIKGIDLVTEGVLTLQKTNLILSKCIKDSNFLDEFENSDEQDGASSLTRALLKDSSSIRFLVGLSDNPAHESIAYSTISLNAKKQLIKEMSNNLERLGKIVNIEMY